VARSAAVTSWNKLPDEVVNLSMPHLFNMFKKPAGSM